MVKITQNIINEIKQSPATFAKSLTPAKLETILRSLSTHYYNTNESLVSDELFDLLKNELRVIDPKNSFLTEVGAPVIRKKVTLPYPMGSLDKIKPDTDALTKWLAKYPDGPYVLSDKLDGLSAQIYKHTDGRLSMYTRGNGTIGQDISHLLKYILPKSVNLDELSNNIAIRGELIISRKNFDTMKDTMANARNTVAGLVNSKSIDGNVANKTDFIAYSILNPRYVYDEQLKMLNKLHFTVVPYKIIKKGKLTNELLNEYLLERRTNSLYEIDGIVVCDSSKIYEHEEGYPEYAFAFKTVLDDQKAEVIVKDVIWDVSMDGYLKPVVQIEPVELVGVTITYATGHNAKFIVDNKIGPGAVIEIVRSGDVIPYIKSVVKPTEPKMPSDKYDWNETSVDIILQDFENSSIAKSKLITHFFTKLKIQNINIGVVTKLVNANFDTIPKILDAIKNKKNDLFEIDGIGEKLIQKIETNIINAFKSLDLHDIMAATHIFGRGLGERKIKEIIVKYPTIMHDKLTKEELQEKIMSVDGFSTISAKKFTDNLNEFKKLFEEINKIYKITLNKQKTFVVKSKTVSELIGKSIVFTGFRDADLEKKIENLGGKVSSSVSSKTFIVIVAGDESSSKIVKAKELKVPIVQKNDFVKKYNIN